VLSTAEDLLRLPMSRELVDDDLEPIALPVLLHRRLGRREVSGSLRLTGAGKALVIAIQDGVAYLRKSDQAELLQAIKWTDGAYSFEPHRPTLGPSLQKTGLVGLAIEVLKTFGRTVPEAELRRLLAPRLERTPRLRLEAKDRIGRLKLTGGEVRLIESAMDGTRTGAELITRGGVGPQTVLLLFAILSAFDYLEWRVAAEVQKASLADEVNRRAAALHVQNHFDVLGVHWSAKTAELETAYDRVRSEFGPATRAFAAAPVACKSILERAETAFRALYDDRARIAYRRSVIPDLDLEAVTDLLTGTAESLEMRGAKDEAQKTRTTIQEIRRSAPPPPIGGRRPTDPGDKKP
jgi:hypothetical protein